MEQRQQGPGGRRNKGRGRGDGAGEASPAGELTSRVIASLGLLPRPWLDGYRSHRVSADLAAAIENADHDELQAILVEVICELERRLGGPSSEEGNLDSGEKG